MPGRAIWPFVTHASATGEIQMTMSWSQGLVAVGGGLLLLWLALLATL